MKKRPFIYLGLVVVTVCLGVGLARRSAFAQGQSEEEQLALAAKLNDEGLKLYAQGKYAEVEPLFKRALAIREKALGPDHPDVASSLNNLAMLYHKQGKYAEAEPLFKRALVIDLAAYGPDHPEVARGLNNLAGLYLKQGRYAEAEPLYKRALEIFEKTLGPEDPRVASSLNNLAGLYGAQGRYAEAEPLYKRALAIREKALGPDHPDVASALNNLAGLYDDQARYAEAEPLYKRSLAIREKVLGPEHPQVATCLNNLAVLYRDQGKYAEAEPLYKRALAIKEKALGPEHPGVALSLNNLAGLAVANSDLDGAWNHALRAREILLGARQRAAASALTRSSFQAEYATQEFLACLALVLQKKVDVLELLEQERALALRELLAQAQAQTVSALPEKDSGRVMTALGRINALNSRLEELAGKGLSVEQVRYELQRAEMDYDSLMAELSERYQQFVAAETARGITSEQATNSSALDEKTAIVGWVEFQDWVWGYVLRKQGVNWTELPCLKDPSDAQLVRRMLLASRDAASGALHSKDLAELYRRRFAPLEPHLEGVERLVIIAQGWAGLLPAEMLLTSEPTEAEQEMANWPWLCERYEISYAPSVTTLDILCRQRVARKDRQWERPLFALADPPFSDAQLAQMQSEKVPAVFASSLAEQTARESSSDALRQLIRFDPKAAPARLPLTRREAEALAHLLGADRSLVLIGPDATERKLFEASAAGELAKCRYVHLSTHGLADGERPELSSLVLARVPPDPDYDGMLQMREVFHLKLDADLVVLSACQTGLGKQLGGEGIVGLSTAFFFAGTPSLVMSLWNVGELSSALLMHRFYQNLLAGQDKSAALREAKSWLRNLTRSEMEKLGGKDPLLSELTRALGELKRAEKGELAEVKPFSHPRYWAPFVLTGDPR